MTKEQAKSVSQCCGADTDTNSGEKGTLYDTCRKCGQPCVLKATFESVGGITPKNPNDVVSVNDMLPQDAKARSESGFHNSHPIPAHDSGKPGRPLDPKSEKKSVCDCKHLQSSHEFVPRFSSVDAHYGKCQCCVCHRFSPSPEPKLGTTKEEILKDLENYYPFNTFSGQTLKEIMIGFSHALDRFGEGERKDAIAQHDATYHPITKHLEMVHGDKAARELWQSEAHSAAIDKAERVISKTIDDPNLSITFRDGLIMAKALIAVLKSKP